jgi:excisionase family DNA binding protein
MFDITAEYTTIRAAAKELGCHEQTIYSRIRAGLLTTAKVGGTRHFIRKSDVERMKVDLRRYNR